MKILVGNKIFVRSKFSDENELEKAVVDKSREIFGVESLYIDVKRKIKGKRVGFTNIPDGYVIDFRESPRLWVVENELSTHDSFNHIGIQLLKFATQFSEGSYALKELILKHIESDLNIKSIVQKLSSRRGFSNISLALDQAIFKNEYGFVVVIDEVSEELYQVTRELARQPELVTIVKYESGKETIYLVDELLEEVDHSKSKKVKEIREIDTMVAPARAGGHKRAFIEQKAWWAVRIAPTILPKLKYLAMYEVRPISAIRWIGKIDSIEPYEDTGKYKIYLSEIYKLPKSIKLGDPRNTPYGPRYTKYELLEKAKTLGDI